MSKNITREEYLEEFNFLIKILVKQINKDEEKILKVIQILYKEILFLENKNNKITKENRIYYQDILKKVKEQNNIIFDNIEDLLKKESEKIFSITIPGTLDYIKTFMWSIGIDNDFILTKNLDNKTAIDLHSSFYNYDSFKYFKDKEKEMANGMKEWRKIDEEYEKIEETLEMSDELLTQEQLQITYDRILHYTTRYPELYVICDDIVYKYALDKIKKIAIIGKNLKNEDVLKILKDTEIYAKSILNFKENSRVSVKFKKEKK
jgi:hypothetical protein